MLLEHNPVTFTGVLQCLSISSRLQLLFFVNTLAEEMRTADDVNIVEYSDGKWETEQKSELAKSIPISTAKSKPEQVDKKDKYF